MGVLSREFLGKLRLEADEVVIIDMEAGLEHFGRGIETSIDSVLIVVEPSFESLQLADRINDLAAEASMDNIWVVLNKVASEDIALELSDELKKEGINVIGSIGNQAIAEFKGAGMISPCLHRSGSSKAIELEGASGRGIKSDRRRLCAYLPLMLTIMVKRKR